MNRVIIVRESIAKVVRMLADKEVQVTQRGSKAFVEYNKRGQPTRVNVPYIPDDASETLLDAIQGFIDHEVGHILHTDFDVLVEAKKNKVAQVHNVIEDAYIEKKQAITFAGSAHNLTNVGNFFLKNYTDVKLREKPSEAEGLLMVPAIRAWSGQTLYADYMKDKWHLLTRITDRIADIIPEFAKVNSSRDGLELALKMKARLERPKPEPKKEEPKKAESKKPEAGSSGSGKGESEPKPKKEKEEKAKPEEKPKEKEAPETPETPEKESDEDEVGDDMPETGDEADTDGDADESSDEEESDGDSPDHDGDDIDIGGDEAASEPETTDSGDSDEDDPDAEEGGEHRFTGEDGEEDREDRTSEPAGDGEEGDIEVKESGKKVEGELDDSETGEEKGGDKPGGDVVPGDGGEGGSGVYGDMVGGMPDDFDEEVSKLLADATLDESKATDYIIYTKDYDKIEKLEVPTGSGYWNDEYLKRQSDDVDHMIGPLQKDLERAVAARSAATWTAGHRNGKLHSSGLARLTVGDDRVFRRKHVSSSKDVAISLLIDASGSMGGSRISIAARAAYGISSVLDRMNITHEVLAFTTQGTLPGFGYGRGKEAEAVREEEARLGKEYARTENLYMPILKMFTERMTADVKRRFAWLPVGVCLSQNVDGECVQIAATRLQMRREGRKILMVFSDGSPMCPGNVRAQSRHLKKVVKELVSQRVECIGIGIQTESVKTYYPKNVVLNDLSELPTTVMKQIKAILMK